MNIFDQFISFFAPKSGLQRAKFRMAVEAVRAYEGAARTKRTASWCAPGTSQNAEADRSLVTLRNRSRDLIRNNPYANRASQLIPANVVGKGIQANIQVVGNNAEAKKKKLQDLWNQWILECDLEGKLNFAAMQFLMLRSTVGDGEVLCRKRLVKGGVLPLKLQLLESDFLDMNMVLQSNNGSNKIIQGIEIDQYGRKVAYHMYESHPGSMGVESTLGNAYKLQRITADDVIHMFRTERPGQLRGIPWFAPVMIRLRDFDDFEDAQLMRQKIAACFSVFIRDIDADSATNSTNENGENLGDKVSPGTIEFLPSGKSVEFANPPGVQGYGEYSQNALRGIATGLGVSYEALTGDLSQVNFSSGRMGWIEFGRNIDAWRENIINNDFNAKVFQWFLEACTLVGINTDGVTATWVAPAREMIDPVKETEAKVAGIKAGLLSFSDAIRGNGKDPATHMKELADDIKALDSLGLKLSSDFRNENKQQATNKPGKPAKDEADDPGEEVV